MAVDSLKTPMQSAWSSRRTVLRAVGAGAVVTLLSGRLGSVARAQSPFPTRIRVLHAAPPLGKVEVLFNGEKKLDEFTYGTTSDWIEVGAGLVRVTISRDRAGINYIVYDAIAPVVANEDYELILSDPLVIPVPVDRSPLAADTARVRVVHAAVDVPAVDIAQKGGDVIIENVGYGQLSDPLEVPAGSYDLEARLQGTSEAAFALPTLTVEGGTVYQVVAYGIPGDSETPLTVGILSDAARAPIPAATPTR
ncbi:MAG: DUF4397 domain-containing protein [Chloroflexia bacterium]|nr:DUF4397 domain-containing protein [Chloroflexia bacterium]